ncbi:hypothetical protein M0R45_019078 [Rubus argutus]|uniref:Peptidase C1A papain C-terminal domain-containing protein n=1 Tax=Rubus argutus TaxID=59490 RepID=A0AAW1X7X1_RUBAR
MELLAFGEEGIWGPVNSVIMEGNWELPTSPQLLCRRPTAMLTDVVPPVTKNWRGRRDSHLSSRPRSLWILLDIQQLVDCAGAFNNFGCHCGLPSQAFEYIKYNGGLDTEQVYP